LWKQAVEAKRALAAGEYRSDFCGGEQSVSFWGQSAAPRSRLKLDRRVRAKAHLAKAQIGVVGHILPCELELPRELFQTWSEQ
jgi:hypothetical protein